VPYDFDFSGLVNARYAEPNPKLSISSVTRRLYRGLCEHNASMDASLALFREKEPEIRHIVASVEGMDDKTRDWALGYIDDFYEDTADAKSVERNLLKKCLSRD